MHLMTTGLKAPLKESARFPVILTFEEGGEIRIAVEVWGAEVMTLLAGQLTRRAPGLSSGLSQ